VSGPHRVALRWFGALALVPLVVGCGSTHHRANSSRPGPPAVRLTPSGYAVPSPLVAGRPGALVAIGDAPQQAAQLGAAHAWRFLYHSTDLSDHDIAVSALLLLPARRAPAHGWPLVAWAHGTTGLADQCAPSVARDLGNDQNAVHEVRALIARGWAVVASDYPGLGTPGVHSYLIGAADARAVIDSVSAAHQLLGTQLSPKWVTVGHSEGGQTSLFVAQTADRRAPQWNFAGTVALAPASTLEALIPLAESTHDPVEESYLIYALAGLSTVDPSVDVARLLTPQAFPVLADTNTGCIDDIVHDLDHRHLQQMLRADPATLTRLGGELGRYDDPDRAPAREPILIAQGTTDEDVPAGATDALTTRLCALGDHVEYRRYPGLDHNTLIGGSQDLVADWVTQRFAQQAATSTCAPKR
jgi:alpha-beta hydrolase superfamily lysophospholipase